MALSAVLASMLQLAASGTSDPVCGANENAQALALLIMNHESQQRSELQCNELLVAVAAERAIELIDGEKPGALTPNEALIESGFRFASYYPPVGNQVQAVATDLESPESALNDLARSAQHSELVLGEGEFFSRQTQIGVGFHKTEDGQMQYVVLIAEPYSSPNFVIKHEIKAPNTVTDEACGKAWRSSRNEELRKACREERQNRKDRNRE